LSVSLVQTVVAAIASDKCCDNPDPFVKVDAGRRVSRLAFQGRPGAMEYHGRRMMEQALPIRNFMIFPCTARDWKPKMRWRLNPHGVCNCRVNPSDAKIHVLIIICNSSSLSEWHSGRGSTKRMTKSFDGAKSRVLSSSEFGDRRLRLRQKGSMLERRSEIKPGVHEVSIIHQTA
jgi:hypothetical protein